MSVVKNKRIQSPHDFWWKMDKLKQYTYEKIANTPKRKFRWICKDIGTHTANAAHYVLTADEIYVRSDKDLKQRYTLLCNAMAELESLQPFLYNFWNIQRTESKKMEFWSNSINEEMIMIAGLIKKESDNELKVNRIKPLRWKQIRDCKYVAKMSEYHRYVHGKVIHIPFQNLDSNELIKLVDTAFYDVVESNWKIPETKEEYESRTAYINDAIQKLTISQTYVYALWNLKPYSEREMNEWSNLLDETLRLLQAVKKSDANRFRSLT